MKEIKKEIMYILTIIGTSCGVIGGWFICATKGFQTNDMFLFWSGVVTVVGMVLGLIGWGVKLIITAQKYFSVLKLTKNSKQLVANLSGTDNEKPEKMKDFVQKINHQFYDFVLRYDTTNDNIIRKIIHTTTVADMCFSIACKLKLNETDRSLAYLGGMLHDIGRFEQWKRYGTYNDQFSVDHGDLSYELCDQFDLSMLSVTDRETIKLAVKYHTKPYTGTNERIKLFNQIIMNADAYANILNTANGAQRMTVTADGYTPAILDDFINLKRVRDYSPKTKVDRALLLTACLYYVRYDFLRNQILAYNFFDVVSHSFLQYLNPTDQKVYLDAVATMRARYLDPAYSHHLV